MNAAVLDGGRRTLTRRVKVSVRIPAEKQSCGVWFDRGIVWLPARRRETARKRGNAALVAAFAPAADARSPVRRGRDSMFLLSHLLKRFVRTGTLTVIGPDGGTHRFGGGPGPLVVMRLKDRALPLKLFLRPEMAVGEAYMEGTLTFEGCTLHDFF